MDGVPTIIMKGLSKEVPWPGARCGWIEVYNKESDAAFARYIKTIHDAKMLEVCTTTLPQKVLPRIYSNPEYIYYLQSRRNAYRSRAEKASPILNSIPGISVIQSTGAFYLTVLFDENVLTQSQMLSIADQRIAALLEEKVLKIPPNQLDKRFVYYLMASYGLCVVPLTGFNSSLYGFRMTLLEEDSDVFSNILSILSEAIPAYLNLQR